MILIYLLTDVFADLGRLPAICKGHLTLKSAPKLLKLANGTDAVKGLCPRIDLIELGEDMFKLSMKDFEKKGADEKTVREFLPMFQLIVKVLGPIYSLEGLPKPLRGLVDDFWNLTRGDKDDIMRKAKKKMVYEPMMKFLMDVRTQDLLFGINRSNFII